MVLHVHLAPAEADAFGFEAEALFECGVSAQFDLPTRLPKNVGREKILKAVKFDKKFENGKIRFVVIAKIGTARIATNVTMQDIREAVAQL